MRRFVALAVALLLSVALCSCSRSPSKNSTVDPVEATPESISLLSLDTEANLDGMTYRYNNTWTETSDPLTSATIRSYNIDLGSEGIVGLMLAAVQDDATSQAVQNLRTQNDADREAVINSMLTAQEGTLSDASSQRADIPPSGTRAMWAYEGRSADGQYVHGYTYVGGRQLYQISVTTPTQEAYASFEPTWKSLINQLQFTNIEPIEVASPDPTPELTPEPAPESTPEPKLENTNDLYLGRWYGQQDDGSSWLDLTIEPSSTTSNGYTITGTRTFPESDPSFFKLNAVEDGDGLLYTGIDTTSDYGVEGTVALGDGNTPNIVVSCAYDKYDGEIVMWFYLNKI